MVSVVFGLLDVSDTNVASFSSALGISPRAAKDTQKQTQCIDILSANPGWNCNWG